MAFTLEFSASFVISYILICIFVMLKLFIAINPSQYTHRYDAPKLGKILLSQNVELNGQQLVMKGVSFIIAQEA